MHSGWLFYLNPTDRWLWYCLNPENTLPFSTHILEPRTWVWTLGAGAILTRRAAVIPCAKNYLRQIYTPLGQRGPIQGPVSRMASSAGLLVHQSKPTTVFVATGLSVHQTKVPTAPAATALPVHQPKPSTASTSSAPAVIIHVAPQLSVPFSRPLRGHDRFLDPPLTASTARLTSVVELSLIIPYRNPLWPPISLL